MCLAAKEEMSRIIEIGDIATQNDFDSLPIQAAINPNYIIRNPMQKINKCNRYLSEQINTNQI